MPFCPRCYSSQYILVITNEGKFGIVMLLLWINRANTLYQMTKAGMHLRNSDQILDASLQISPVTQKGVIHVQHGQETDFPGHTAHIAQYIHINMHIHNEY